MMLLLLLFLFLCTFSAFEAAPTIQQDPLMAARRYLGAKAVMDGVTVFFSRRSMWFVSYSEASKVNLVSMFANLCLFFKPKISDYAEW